MSEPAPSARIAIDARLAAYRGGGIAEHVARLELGLAEVAPEADLVLLRHRRERYAAAWHWPWAAVRSPGADAGRPFPARFLWTPPHFPLEKLSPPLEIASLGAGLLHSPDVVLPARWRGAGVATVHDVAFLRRPELLTSASLRYYRGIHASVRRADRVIVVSEYTRRELVATTDVVASKVVVVPNAVHPRYLAPGNPDDDAERIAAYGLAPRFLLFASTIEPRKNVGVLLEAVQALRNEGRALSLALAGADGWHSAPVAEQVRALGLESVARFLGYVPDADLAALYRQAALLAHPALDEGFGLTPPEAMAAGTPVVVSAAGSLPEVVGEAGLQVSPTDPRAWAEAIAAVLDDAPLARRLGAAGQARAAQFSRRMAEATWAVYAAALAAHRSRSGR